MGNYHSDVETSHQFRHMNGFSENTFSQVPKQRMMSRRGKQEEEDKEGSVKNYYSNPL